MRINSNIFSLTARRTLALTTKALARSMERLASGSRVNSARDDAAGLAIGNGLDAQRRGMMQTIRNMNDARGFLDTAEGAMAVQTQLVQRMRELAIQAANGVLSDDDRAYLNAEAQQLAEEINRISTQTEFNGTKLLDASFTGQSLQVGTSKGDTINISLSATRAVDLFARTELTPTGNYEMSSTISIGDTSRSVTTADFNGDGYADILTGYSGGAATGVTVAFGNGDGTFQSRITLTTNGQPWGVRTADMNSDGELDIIVADFVGGGSIILSNGNGTFRTRTTIATGSNPRYITAADFNADGKLDLATSDTNSATASISLGNGDGTFAARTTIATGANPAGIDSGDLNGDGHADLVIGDNGGLAVYFGNGNGTFQARSSLFSQSQSTLSIVDLDNDSKSDLVWSNGGNTWSALGNGNGTFQAAVTLSGFSGTGGPLADIDDDGILDLLLTSYNVNQVGFAIGNGDGTFAVRWTASTGLNPTGVAAADFNEDGFVDLVATNLGESIQNIYLAETLSVTDISVSIASQSEAEDMLDIFDDALEYLNSARSDIGAIQSRLDFARSVTETTIENISASKSQIMDADFALEMADFTRLQILEQGGLSVLAQSNVQHRMALELIQNISRR